MLAEALSPLSLDLVSLVCSYIAFRSPTAGAQPKLLFTLGSTSAPDGKLAEYCLGVACSARGDIWASFRTHVQIFSSAGKFRCQVTGHAWGASKGLAIDSEGAAYIADAAERAVVVCSADGKFARQIGGKTNQCMGGERVDWLDLARPQDCDVDSKRDLLFVCQSQCQTGQVLVLTRGGKLVRSWGRRGKGRGQLSEACSIAVCADTREVAVVEYYGHRVQVRVEFCWLVSDAVLVRAGFRLQWQVFAQIWLQGLW